MNQKLNVALIVGGTSPEREVSKSSGKSIYEALLNLGHNVTLLDPAYGKNQPDEPNLFFDEKDFCPISNSNYIEVLNLEIWNKIDIAFLALHGKWGEDGTIQSIFELKGIKYTGSKVLSSAVAMDKIMSKILFEDFNVPTAKWFSIDKENYSVSEIKDKIINEYGFPVVIKSNDQGSSVGVTVCQSEKEIETALKLGFEFSDRVLIEEYIPGREVTVAILDGKPMPVLEIKPKHGVYDYECKYTSGMSEYIVPADIPEEVFKEIQETSVRAYNALRCEVYARVDFRLSPDNKAFALEVNTLPGMTSLSLVPKMAKTAGLSFETLIQKIIELSLK